MPPQSERLSALPHSSGELLAELGQLRSHDISAIGLLGVVAEILLVVILSHVELLRGADLRDDRPAKHLVALQLGNHLLRNLPLLLGVAENGGAVLRPVIAALPVQRGRVVDGEEDLQDLAERSHGRVESYLYHFHMSGVPGAYGAI